MTDSLSRLRAGLDRDEAIARAASEIHGEHWRPGAAFGDEWDRLEGSGITAIGYDMHESVPPHLALHDPSRVLRQVAAIRELLGYFSHPGCRECPEAVIEALASIYPEDTTETGDTR